MSDLFRTRKPLPTTPPRFVRCSSAVAHLKCIETWIHYKARPRPRPYARCVQPFRLPRPLAPPSAALTARLQRIPTGNRVSGRVWTTLLDMRFPVLVGVLCGYCGDMFAKFTARGARVVLAVQLYLMFLWLVCVVRPGSRPGSTASPTGVRCSWTALMWIYFTYFFSGPCPASPCRISPGSPARIMHQVNMICLSGTILLRILRALCHPRPTPLAAPPPPPPYPPPDA